MKVCTIILLGFIILALNEARICPEIQISSNITKVKNDMVKNGVTEQKWLESSSTPIIIGSSKQIDYIYVSIERHVELQDNTTQFKLIFDDRIYANSSIKLDVSHPQAKETEVAVEINYLCNDYGGALINYELEVELAECGQAKVFWKKLCGNPLIPRDGLSIDLVTDRSQNQTVVKNGKVLNSSYFDRDIENFVYTLDEKTNKTIFYLYMDNTSILSNESDPVIKALRDMIRLVPETKYSKIKVDADQSLVTPILEGRELEGGYITTKKIPIVLEFKCLGRKGSSLIEFTIPLDYFKDITFFFMKFCDGAEDPVYTGHSEIWAIIIWLIVLTLMSCILATLYNMFVHKKKGYDSVPGLEKVIKLALAAKFIRESRIGSKLTEINQVHFNALKGNASEPEESEFKIENISEISSKDKSGKETPSKYGSI